MRFAKESRIGWWSFRLSTGGGLRIYRVCPILTESVPAVVVLGFWIALTFRAWVLDHFDLSLFRSRLLLVCVPRRANVAAVNRVTACAASSAKSRCFLHLRVFYFLVSQISVSGVGFVFHAGIALRLRIATCVFSGCPVDPCIPVARLVQCRNMPGCCLLPGFPLTGASRLI